MYKLVELNKELAQNSISLLDGITLNFELSFMLFGYAVNINLPYIFLIAVDLAVFVISIITMFHYSFYAGKLTTGHRLETMIKHTNYLLILVFIFLSILILSIFVSNPFSAEQSLYFFGGLYSISLTKLILKLFVLGIWLVWLNFFTLQRLAGIEDSLVLSTLALAIAFSLISINHLVLLFLSLEGFSLILYVLATTGKQFGGTTAATQYFIFGSFGSIMLLLGISILYEASGIMSLSSWELVNLSGAVGMIKPYTLGAGFIALGLLLKFGAAPLHGWVVEVYSNLPYYLMWFYSIFVKIIIGIVMFRVISAIPTFGVLEYFGIISLVIGCLGALRQSEIKKFFAYGSIMHVGFLLLSDMVSFQIYLITYVLSMVIIGLVITNIRINGQEIVYLSDLGTSVGKSPASLIIMLFIAMLSVSGIPPLAGFWGKYSVFISLFTNSGSGSLLSLTAVSIAVAATMLAFFYYFRLLTWICLGFNGSKAMLAGSPSIFSTNNLVTMLAIFVIIILFGFGFILHSYIDLFINSW